MPIYTARKIQYREINHPDTYKFSTFFGNMRKQITAVKLEEDCSREHSLHCRIADPIKMPTLKTDLFIELFSDLHLAKDQSSRYWTMDNIIIYTVI